MQVETVDYRAADAAETLERSLRETGFAVLANHPITPERINAIYDAWGRFFAGEDKFTYAVSRRHMTAISPSGPKTPRIRR